MDSTPKTSLKKRNKSDSRSLYSYSINISINIISIAPIFELPLHQSYFVRYFFYKSHLIRKVPIIIIE